MTYPAATANLVVLWGRWWDHLTKAGVDATITATPLLATGQAGSGSPNLVSLVDQAEIKTAAWSTKPLPGSGLWALPLLPTNDAQFGAFGGYRIQAGSEPPFIVEILESTPTMVMSADMIAALNAARTHSNAAPIGISVNDVAQAVWVRQAAVLQSPAVSPPAGVLTSDQVVNLVAGVRQLPPGGTPGQVPTPKADGGYEWVAQSGGGGGGGTAADATPTSKGIARVADGTADDPKMPWGKVTGKPTFAAVATTGSFGDLSGTVPASALPALAINDTTVVADQAAMLALTAQRGDIAIRQDRITAQQPAVYILGAEGASTLANWINLPVPADAVASVAGKTGVVTLAKGDVGLGNVDNTSDATKPVSTDQATAIAARIARALIDAKGDLIVGTADDTPARLGVGTDGQVLTANSGAASGLSWQTPSAGSSGDPMPEATTAPRTSAVTASALLGKTNRANTDGGAFSQPAPAAVADGRFRFGWTAAVGTTSTPPTLTADTTGSPADVFVLADGTTTTSITPRLPGQMLEFHAQITGGGQANRWLVVADHRPQAALDDRFRRPYGLAVGRGTAVVPTGIRGHASFDARDDGITTRTYRTFQPLSDPTVTDVLPIFGYWLYPGTFAANGDTDPGQPMTIAAAVEMSDGAIVPFTFNGQRTFTFPGGLGSGGALAIPDAPRGIGNQTATTTSRSEPVSGFWLRVYVSVAASRTDTASITSGSATVTDSTIASGDQGKAVTGTGIPAGSYVGTVTPGTSFLLSSSPVTQVNVNATATNGSASLSLFVPVPLNMGQLTSGESCTTVTGADLTLPGSGNVSGGASAYFYGPLTVLSRAATQKPIIGAFTDSILDGYSETNTIYYGPVARACNALGLPIVKFSKAGSTSSDWLPGVSNRYRAPLIDGVTHAVLSLGTNDGFLSTLPITTVQTRFTTLSAHLAARGIKTTLCTIPPRSSSSTDGYATPAGQTLNSGSAQAPLAAFNAWARGGASAVAATTLSSAASSGATTVTTAAAIPAGTIVLVGVGTAAEVRTVTAVSGTGPYTITLSSALTAAKASGVDVRPVVQVNAGIPTGYTACFDLAALLESSITPDSGQWAPGPNSRRVTDAAITSGTNQLTSATANFTSADVGTGIYVAGTLFATQIWTITAVTDAQTATLGTNSNATVSGAVAGIGAWHTTTDGVHPSVAMMAGPISTAMQAMLATLSL